MSYPSFFKQATGHAPYPWQGRLANGEGYEPQNEDTHRGVDCDSKLIDIPTGLGKTAGVVLAWLWNTVGAISRSPSQAQGDLPKSHR